MSRSQTRASAIFFLLSFVLLGPLEGVSVSLQQTAARPADKEAYSEDELLAAPVFALRDLRNRKHKVADLHARIVVLDFWATWCEPCVAEIPSLNQLQAKYGAQGVKVIGLAVQSGWPKDIRRFVAKHKMDYTILVGTDDTVADFDVISFPTTFLIAPGWRVYKKYTGAYDGKDAEIERDIKALLTRKQ